MYPLIYKAYGDFARFNILGRNGKRIWCSVSTTRILLGAAFKHL